MHEELMEKIEYMIEKHPDKVVEFAKKVYRENPEAVERMLENAKSHHGHIANKRKYEELVEKLKWANGNGRGAKWSFEDIKKNAKVNFEHSDFTEYDFAYLVNMLYAKCCKEFSDPSLFLRLAKCLLEDNDEETKLYQGAYSNKHKYQNRGEQSYYDEDNYYNEENRRRRYRSEYDNYNDYEEENRRGVRRYRNDSENRRYYNNDDDYNSKYYKESNMGFK